VLKKSLRRGCATIENLIIDGQSIADIHVIEAEKTNGDAIRRGEVCDPMSCLSMSTTLSTDQVSKSALTKSASTRLAAELFHVVTPT
jgi:hypothetical protein